MRIDKALEQSMAMSDATWKRHANPLSVYTRIPIFPLLAFSVWSRMWLGWWFLLPLGLVIAWTLYNPRAFPPPKSLDNWASKVVLGERIWLARKESPIPSHHSRWALWLGVAGGLSLLPAVWGLYVFNPWAAGLGVLLVVTFKLWFCDRMSWLFEDQNRG